MATVNRYTQLPVAQYNPMSMQELAFAPTFLRQRHDATAEALANLEQASGQYDVLEPYRMVANQAVDPLQKGIANIAEQLATQGVNRSNAVTEAMKLKSQYTNLFGQSGAIGQLQNATKQYRTQAEAIQKFFEKNPELARGALRELKPGEATYQDGKLTLGQMYTPSYVRHYDAKEINDILNNQIDNIKDTLLKDYGFQNVGSISSIQDVYRQGQLEGRSAEDIQKILQAQLSPEIIQSARQYGKYVYGNEKLGEEALMTQLTGAAYGRASQKLNTSYSIVTNEDRKFDRDNLIQNWASQDLPGTVVIADPVAEKLYSNMSTYQTVQQNLDAYTQVGRDGKLKIRVDMQGNPIPKNKIMGQNVSIKYIDYIDFEGMKNSSERFKNMPTSEFIAKFNKYQKDISASYDKAIIPVGKDMSWLQERVIGNKNKEGLISLRQIQTPQGDTASIDQFLQKAGYSNVTEFYENAAPSLKGYSAANGGYAFTYRDKNGDSQTAYIEADSALKGVTSNTIQLTTLAKSGASFVNLKEPVVVNNQTLYKYFVNDYSNGFNGVKLVLATSPDLSETDITNNLSNYVVMDFDKVRLAEQQQFQTDKEIAQYFK